MQIGMACLIDIQLSNLIVSWPVKRMPCFAFRRETGAVCCVIETRYLDRDYRSEYTAYHARSFRLVPDAAHRLHFFARQLKESDLGQLPLALKATTSVTSAYDLAWSVASAGPCCGRRHTC